MKREKERILGATTSFAINAHMIIFLFSLLQSNLQIYPLERDTRAFITYHTYALIARAILA